MGHTMRAPRAMLCIKPSREVGGTTVEEGGCEEGEDVWGVDVDIFGVEEGVWSR